MTARMLRVLSCATAMTLCALPALAYVGPGAGITLVGALWGVVIAVVAALGFVLMWPLRRVFASRGRRARGHAQEGRSAVQPDQR